MLEQPRSHRRLFISLGLSSAILATLLTLLPGLVNKKACYDLQCFDEPNVLEVNIEHREPERIAEIVLPADKLPAVTREQQELALPGKVETARNELKAGREASVEPPHDLASTRNWQDAAKESARQSTADRFVREKKRQSMWRSTGSVMFRDTGEFDFHEPASVMADQEFRIPVGVLGIGITIGSCFIGIPLAGIPVEKRTVGPTLVYCTDIYE